eukprot:scaffold41679_cov17-Tisochrysis_lutea.AAC.1
MDWCGHVFGDSCIRTWLAGHGNKCPACNKRCVCLLTVTSNLGYLGTDVRPKQVVCRKRRKLPRQQDRYGVGDNTASCVQHLQPTLTVHYARPLPKPMLKGTVLIQVPAFV